MATTNTLLADVPVVILAGGRGTRLSEVTHEIPKPMVPIGEYPMLLHIMRYYASFGHRKFIVCLGYLGNVIKDYYLNIDRNTASLTLSASRPSFSHSVIADWHIELVETGAETLTGTRLARVASLLKSPHFCLTYGDGVTDIPLDKEWEYHLSHGKIGTVGAVHPPARFGNLELTAQGGVTSFIEKAPLRHDFINGG
jgi:glucose-1-phosphate cytidylyltransferase